MPSLTIDQVLAVSAWQQAQLSERDVFAHGLSAEDKLKYGRLAVTTHAPNVLPEQTMICRNCHDRYPCWLASWGMALLKELGWTEDDLLALIDHLDAGGRP